MPFMRYRRLTEEEFSAVEGEFVKFLASQGLDAAEWQKVKSDNPHKVEYLLDEFSTFFWDSTTSRIVYLEKVTKEDRWLFKFEESCAKVLRWQQSEVEAKPSISKGKKEFPEEARAREIFLLLEQGLVPCAESRHKELEQLFS
ncbi:MAG: hypothetical protein CL823_03090 [Crocinitomicaceae bacterium]|nr:hypothetical protein [Crocinitomicaceae bacterium]|tara:strand:- start:2295 stop:2723 length:429 start_codon:yes stop_codon:yes gene_type:complete